MAKTAPPTRVTCFLLLAACGALCQSEHSSVTLLQRVEFDTSNVSAQRQEISAWKSLPDAPSSVQPPPQTEQFQMFANEPRSLVTADGGRARVTHGMQPRLVPFFQTGATQKESSAFLDKYLYPSLLERNLRFRPSTEGSFLGRASYAASRIFITRDESGKGRLNTPYFLGLLTSIAIHTAYRPYWARSTSETFNNFGSTIGSDAGTNLYREFGPGIQQMLKSHAPKFVSAIQERITRGQARGDTVFAPVP